MHYRNLPFDEKPNSIYYSLRCLRGNVSQKNKIMHKFIPIILLVFLTSGCAVGWQNISAPVQAVSGTYFGKASFYGNECQGELTANGERFDMYKLTAAHRTLPFGSKVKVVNIQNGKSVVVRINDRGPNIKTRIIDLSYAAADDIGMIEIGVADVKLEVLE